MFGVDGPTGGVRGGGVPAGGATGLGVVLPEPPHAPMLRAVRNMRVDKRQLAGTCIRLFKLKLERQQLSLRCDRGVLIRQSLQECDNICDVVIAERRRRAGMSIKRRLHIQICDIGCG